MKKLTSPALAALLLVAGLAMVAGAPPAHAANPERRWQRELPGGTIRGSSPLGIDLDGGGT
ncbi:MAG: hypothetical protein M3394_08380, partial [Actinomycetota bacterium]|nr:hypothetical protein [Actinomycetota bacterium]